MDAEAFEAITDGGAEVRIVLTNAGGEHEGIDATEFDHESTDPVAIE